MQCMMSSLAGNKRQSDINELDPHEPKTLKRLRHDEGLLGFAQIWPGGQTSWEFGLTWQEKMLVFKALDAPISQGTIVAQRGARKVWKWKEGSADLSIVISLCEGLAARLAREKEAERQQQEAEENHMQSTIAAREQARKLQASWALKHKRILEPLGADFEWCMHALPQQNRRETAEASSEDGEWLLHQPAEVTLPLRSYQLDGLRWLAKSRAQGLSVILGDEMGLGKTLQTIAYLAHLKFDRSIGGPHLILCPLSVLDHWEREFARCCPALRVHVFHVSGGRRAAIDKLCDNYPNGYDVVVTTYGNISSVFCSGFFVNSYWQTIVLDEGHCIKNEKCQAGVTLRKCNFVQALILTGTPLQNNLIELWALLNFLYPELFPNKAVFKSAFNLDPRSRAEGKPLADPESLHKVHELLQLCMLRRMKSLVEVDVPAKVETTIMCPLSHIQKWSYARLLLSQTDFFKQVQAAAKIDGAKPFRGNAWRKLQFLLMQLRKVCNHPYLLPGVDPQSATNNDEPLPLESAEAFVEASGKLMMLDRLLKRLLTAGHRCTIFSQFTSTLDFIEKLLMLRGTQFCRLDGNTARDERGKLIENFNSREALTNIFLLSTRAGGLGINLQTADTCILFDSDWNPQVDLQAMARVHRIGQTRHVHVYRLVTEGTVEERMLNRAQKKLCLDRIVNHPSSISTNVSASVEEWIADVQLESSAVVSSGTSKRISEQDLDAIIDRSRKCSTSVKGVIDGATTHTGSDVVEGRVAVEKNSEEHRREFAAQTRAVLQTQPKPKTQARVPAKGDSTKIGKNKGKKKVDRKST